MRKSYFLLFVVTLILLLFSVALAETDYSYLDDMTINQLKELDAEIHKRIPAEESSSGIVTTMLFGPENNSQPEENGIRQDDDYVLMLDNKYLTVYAKRFEDKTFIERSQPPFYKLGFKLHIINKTSDKWLTLGISNISFNKITLDKGFYGCGYAAPESEIYTEIMFNRIVSEDEKSAFLNTYEDMTNIVGNGWIYYNTDGSNSGQGLEKYDFNLFAENK